MVPTPLTRLHWWRVCLDEAQMVESSTAKATEMALKLRTRHRWAVTGTPLSRGLEDLFGLLAFLRCHPYDSRFWWTRAIQRPYEAGSASGDYGTPKTNFIYKVHPSSNCAQVELLQVSPPL